MTRNFRRRIDKTRIIVWMGHEFESISLELEKLENNKLIFRSSVSRTLKTMKNGVLNVSDETQAHNNKKKNSCIYSCKNDFFYPGLCNTIK